MNKFFLLKSMDEVNYYLMQNVTHVKEKQTVDEMLDAFLAEKKEYVNSVTDDNEFLQALKQDIVSLVAISCNYWASKKEGRLLVWNVTDFEKLDISMFSENWLLDFEVSREYRGRYQTRDFLSEFKKLVLRYPEDWNEALLKNRKYAIDCDVVRAYAELSPVEKYFYQIATGFPVTFQLCEHAKKRGKTDEEEFIRNVCCIKGLRLRQYFVKKYLEGQTMECYVNNIERFLGRIADSFVSERMGLNDDKAIDLWWKEISLQGNYVNQLLIDFGNTFLKMLFVKYCGYKHFKDEETFYQYIFQNSLTVWKRIYRDYLLSNQKNNEKFWIDSDYIQDMLNTSLDLQGDPRNMANERFKSLQKQMMQTILTKRKIETKIHVFFDPDPLEMIQFIK